MIVGKLCDTSAARSSCKEADLHKIRLVNVLDCNGFLTNRCGKGIKSNRATVIVLDNRLKKAAVDVVKAQLVDLKRLKSICSNVGCNGSVALYKGKVTHTLKKSVGNSGCSA